MSAAREEILAAVRSATAGATPPAQVQRSYQRAGERSRSA